jgi:hypothetical protein
MSERLVDKSVGALDKTSTECLKKYLGEHPDILKLFALPNVKNVSSSDVLPSGVVVVVAADAALNPSLLPSKFLSVLTVYQLSTEEGSRIRRNDISNVNKDGKLQIAIDEYCGEGPSLSNTFVVHCDPKMAGKDSKSWTPGLGATGWVAISKHTPRRFESTHYLCVFSSNDKLSQELSDIAEKMSDQTDTHSIDGSNSPLSMLDFAQRKELQYAKILARRNNDYIAKFVADTVGFKLHRLKPDLDGLVDKETWKPNLIALPDTVTYFGHLKKVQFEDDEPDRADGVPQNMVVKQSQPAVVIYNKCGDISASVNGCAVPLSPMNGVALFESTRQHNNVNSNDMMNSVPCGVGYSDGLVSLKDGHREYVQSCVHWSGKQEGRLHSKTLRDYRSQEPIVDLLSNNGVVYKQLNHVFTTLPAE